MIIRKTPEQVDQMAAAGDILVRTMKVLKSKARPGVTTLELDEAAEKFIRSQGAVPSFKGYRGFPGSICASPNSMVVHGIPGDYECKRGDILSIDIGVTYEGWVADARGDGADRADLDRGEKPARGDPQLALRRGRADGPGNHLGDVSNAIQRSVESNGSR